MAQDLQDSGFVFGSDWHAGNPDDHKEKRKTKKKTDAWIIYTLFRTGSRRQLTLLISSQTPFFSAYYKLQIIKAKSNIKSDLEMYRVRNMIVGSSTLK